MRSNSLVHLFNMYVVILPALYKSVFSSVYCKGKKDKMQGMAF